MRNALSLAFNLSLSHPLCFSLIPQKCSERMAEGTPECIAVIFLFAGFTLLCLARDLLMVLQGETWFDHEIMYYVSKLFFSVFSFQCSVFVWGVTNHNKPINILSPLRLPSDRLVN